MKKVVKLWKNGITGLFTEGSISFYTYFSIIFAECAYLWSHFSSSVAMPFTIILLAYVINVIVWGPLKGLWEGTKKELIFSILYVIIFIALFIIGCPCIVFVIFIAMLPAFPIILKVLIPIIYLLCIPLIVVLEDEVACDIFEIAYDIDYNLG